MRALLVLVLLLLASLPLLPSEAEPAPLCDGTCTISSTSLAYLPPTALVTNGSAVQWESLDIFHSNADGIAVDGEQCFSVGYSSSTPSPPVTFTIENGALRATVGATTKLCTHAAGTSEGFVLPYFCVLHPPMRGTLVVVDAP